MTASVQIDKRNTITSSGLSNFVHGQWQTDALSIRPNSPDLSLLLPAAKELAKNYLSNQMRDQIAQINQRGGLSHLHLRSLPRDPHLPPTPRDGKRPDTKQTWVSEIVQLGIIAYALESQVFSYFEQKDGALVQEIAPIKGLENSQSNSSSGKFGPHSDDATFKRDFRAEGIILYCLRNEGGTATLFASVDEIIAAMNPIDVKMLRQPRFRVRTPESFKLYDGKVIYSEPRPIITEGEAGSEIALATYNVQPADPQDEEATTALWALRLALRPPVAKSFVLEPGDILIISNVRGLHARSPILGDRWLQRCYFRKDLTALRHVTNSTDNCRVFSSEKLFLL
jgi:L-asparagine oxygenase